MITVAACGACNAAKSKLDTFLRDFLVCGHGGQPHGVADSLRDGPYQRAVARKQSELWKEINAGTFERIPVSRNAIDLGSYLQIPFGRGPVKDAITYIVRGLYYKMHNTRLPSDHSFLVGGIGDSEACVRWLLQLRALGPIGMAAIGERGKFDVFSSFCAAWHTAEDGVFAATLWGLAFYDRVHIGCITIAKSKRAQLNPRILEQF
jgi:hypothetical protein